MIIKTRNWSQLFVWGNNKRKWHFGTWQNQHKEDFRSRNTRKLTALHVNFSFWKTLGIQVCILLSYILLENTLICLLDQLTYMATLKTTNFSHHPKNNKEIWLFWLIYDVFKFSKYPTTETGNHIFWGDLIWDQWRGKFHMISYEISGAAEGYKGAVEGFGGPWKCSR